MSSRFVPAQSGADFYLCRSLRTFPIFPYRLLTLFWGSSVLLPLFYLVAYYLPCLVITPLPSLSSQHNPPLLPPRPAPLTLASRPSVTTGTAALRPSARSQLPQELQLYFTRLTTALIPTVPAPTDPSVLSEAERHRLAALESLRQDTAIGGILAYIVKWFAESIQKSLVGPTSVGWGLLQGLESLLRNDSVFLEPYVSFA